MDHDFFYDVLSGLGLSNITIWTYFPRIGGAIKSFILTQIHPHPWSWVRSWVSMAAPVMLEDLAFMYKTISFLPSRVLALNLQGCNVIFFQKFLSSCVTTEVWPTHKKEVLFFICIDKIVNKIIFLKMSVSFSKYWQILRLPKEKKNLSHAS